MATFVLAFALGSSLFASVSAQVVDGFARSAPLSDDLDLYWTADVESEVFRLAVHAKEASGWLGFGVSEMGGMEGADIMFYEAEVRHEKKLGSNVKELGVRGFTVEEERAVLPAECDRYQVKDQRRLGRVMPGIDFQRRVTTGYRQRIRQGSISAALIAERYR